MRRGKWRERERERERVGWKQRTDRRVGGGAIDREVILALRKMEQDNKISDVTGLNS
jgi:hypothetical protein